jgi:hypothetical protein
MRHAQELLASIAALQHWQRGLCVLRKIFDSQVRVTVVDDFRPSLHYGSF